jgi:cobalt-zinc-cadmium resistance protein CzcA
MNQRHLTVKANVRGRDLASLLNDAHKAIAGKVKYDTTRYRVEWGGQFENQQRAQARLAFIIPVVLVLIFLLLYAGFGQLRHAALILITVPLALVGGLAALQIRGMTLNVSSAVGFIALFGVAVQNGVIMVAHINRLRAAGMMLAEAVWRGAQERLRPVLITSTVAALGLLPAALTRMIGSDVQRPLATVVVGGLISATVLTLIFLPAAYMALEKRFEKYPECDFEEPKS